MVASKTSIVLAAIALNAATSYAAPTHYNSEVATRGFADDDVALEARFFDDEDLEARYFDEELVCFCCVPGMGSAQSSFFLFGRLATSALVTVSGLS